VGSDNASLIADSTQADGVRWDNVDHTTLKNISTNTHAQIDTFIASKNTPNGYAGLNSFGQVPNEILTPIGSFPSVGPWIGHTDPNPDSTHTLIVYNITNGYARPASGTTKSVAAIDSFVLSKGQVNGLCPLDGSRLIPATSVPNFKSTGDYTYSVLLGAAALNNYWAGGVNGQNNFALGTVVGYSFMNGSNNFFLGASADIPGGTTDANWRIAFGPGTQADTDNKVRFSSNYNSLQFNGLGQTTDPSVNLLAMNSNGQMRKTGLTPGGIATLNSNG
jgi:hypothetical protein